MTNEINYIKKVELSGLWNKFDIVWDLNPDVNILAGINGSGKTTVLNFMCALITRGDIYGSQKGIVKNVKVFFDNEKFLSYEYIKIKDSVSNIVEKANSGDVTSQELLLLLKDREDKDYTKIQSFEIERYQASFEDLEMILNDFKKLISIDVISTFDNSLKQSEAVKKLSDDNVKTELDWEIYHLQNKYIEYQLNISKRKDLILDEQPEDIKEKFETLKYPQNQFLRIMDDLFSETEKKINRDKNQIEFLLDTKEISPYQLSSGEKQLLIILLTVLIQDNKPSILFMDEPEISLHIEWQKKLIQYIRDLNPNVQLIIATHSPALIMEGWLDKVFNISDLIVNGK